MRPNVKPATTIGGFGIHRIAGWAPTLALWGGAGLFGVLYFAERIPMIRRDVFANLPVVGAHWRKQLEEAEAEQ